MTIALIGVGILLILLIMGMNIGICMMAVGFFGFWYVRGLGPALTLFRQIPFTQATTYSFTVIPLFVLMGNLCFYSGMSADLFDTAHKWLGGMKGGLAAATVAACAAFSAICGSTAATAATMGVVALPEMRKHGYDDSLSCGSIAAGGTLGILIPPSTGFIIYGIVSGESIGGLFAAGILPGLLLALCYIAAIAVVVRIWPDRAPDKLHFTFKEKLISLKGGAAMIILFVIAIGGIFSGWFTANEAAAVGAMAALIYLIARRRFTWKIFFDCLRDTVKTSGMIFLILIGAYIFGSFLTITQLPKTLAIFVESLNVSRYIILAVIIVIYAVMGCLMDSLAMVMLTVPIFLPIMTGLGFNGIWYGVLMIMVMEMGLITPPVGMNVYIVAGVAKDVPLQKIFKGVAPMVIGMFVAVVINCAWQDLALYLPRLLGYIT
ncbi:MAG: TRAP transporter large permease [Oscillospiraceae bacterium]|jgi:tripartite ATP-independent transporter DctM subunit|nr:TRAP transporter large permease [Oscillospiraceae bacterium]